jgi:non-specific serine/threonine protein kinase
LRTTLLGRAEEVAQIRALLTTEADRLVTITGTGGIGKTAIALRAAADMQDVFRDGVFLVELASISDGALVASAVTAALGVREAPGSSALQALVQFLNLNQRRVLLVLDNCEHVVDVCAELVEHLISACPTVRVLATSREPLWVRGERQLRLAPLAAPDPDESVTPETVTGYPAALLFLQRAQAIDPQFQITPHNAQAIALVCARLAGLPLALELAAARMRVLNPEQLVERLDDVFGVLVNATRNVPTRQQTLRAALDWSYALLNEPERQVFTCMAVFTGGCDLQALEAVCGTPGGLPSELLDTVSRLVDKSLVIVDLVEPAARYRLLEPVRQYAAHRLAAAHLAEEALARHAAYYLGLMERAESQLGGPDQVAWLGRLDRELGNLRSTLAWLEHHADVAANVQGAASLVPFWEIRGYLGEGRRWLEATLARHDAVHVLPEVRARALLGLGRLAYWQADLESAVELFSESRALARQTADTPLEADALAWFGATRRRQGALADARRVLDESLQLSHGLPPTTGSAWAAFNRAIAVSNPEITLAIEPLEQVLRISRAAGDVRSVAMVCTMLGAALTGRGERERALQLLQEALDGLELIGDRVYFFSGLLTVAMLAVGIGEPASAARLLGAAEAIGQALGATLAPVNRATYETVERAVRAQLRNDLFERERWIGRSMSLAQAVAEARGLTQRRARPTTVDFDQRQSLQPLTTREQEVAQLIGRGYSDRQIAAELGIGVRTVGAHVHRVLNKLDVHSRRQVADWTGPSGLAGDAPSHRE